METLVLEQIKARSGRSKVWKYFGDKFVNDVKINDQLLHCILCSNDNKSLHYKENTSTSTLMYHLRHEHEIELVELNESQRRIQHIFDAKYDPVSPADKKSLLGRRCGLWMSRDLRPASMFSCEGFVDWAVQNKIVKSKSEFPTPSCIAGSALNDIYLAINDKLKQKLKESPSTIIVMLDMWTDAYAKVPYINISIQFLNLDFKFQAYQICTKRFDHPHTAKNLAEILMTTLAEFELDEKDFYLTGDGGANCVAAERFLSRCLAYIKCIAHCLHLLLTADMSKISCYKEIEHVLKKIKRTHGKLAYKTTELKAAYENTQREDVLHYLNEWEDSLTAVLQADEEISVGFEDFENAREEQRLLAEAGQEAFSAFKQSNTTRWTSQYTSLVSYQKNEDAINTLLNHLNANELRLTPEEHQIMRRIIKFLSLFKEATDLLQSTSEPSVHLMILLKEDLMCNLKEFVEHEEIEALKKIGEAAIEKLGSRLKICDEFIAASILDPGQVNSTLLSKYQDSPLQLLKKLYEKYKLDDLSTPSNCNQTLSPASSQSELHETSIASKRMKLINKYILPDTSSPQVHDIDIEFHQYLSMASSWTSTDITQFWRSNSKTLPKLCKLAQIVLAISPTSVVCERAFSVAGIVVNKQTSSLHHVTVHRKLFIHDNHSLLLQE